MILTPTHETTTLLHLVLAWLHRTLDRLTGHGHHATVAWVQRTPSIQFAPVWPSQETGRHRRRDEQDDDPEPEPVTSVIPVVRHRRSWLPWRTGAADMPWPEGASEVWASILHTDLSTEPDWARHGSLREPDPEVTDWDLQRVAADPDAVLVR